MVYVPLAGEDEDVYFSDVRYMWYQLVYIDGDLDLVPESCGFLPDSRSEIARLDVADLEEPVYDPWDDVLENTGLEEVLQIPEGRSRWLTWSMQEGIMPEQPFLVCMPRPRHVRVGWEYIEYDIETEGEVVRVLPPTTGLRELERVINKIAYHRAVDDAQRAECQSRVRALMPPRVLLAPGKLTAL